MADPVASSAVALTSAGLTVFGVATGLNPWHMIAGSAGGLFSLSFHNTPQPLLGRFVANTSASLLASYVTPLAVEMLRIKAVVPESVPRELLVFPVAFGIGFLAFSHIGPAILKAFGSMSPSKGSSE